MQNEQINYMIRLLRVLSLSLGIILLASFMIKGCAYASDVITIEGYTLDQWADAIRHAEGNDNYGILTKYKHTTPRQACKNTVRSKYKQWSLKRAENGLKTPFIDYLASRYAPIGASNDPKGLNKNWKNNVEHWLRRV